MSKIFMGKTYHNLLSLSNNVIRATTIAKANNIIKPNFNNKRLFELV